MHIGGINIGGTRMAKRLLLIGLVMLASWFGTQFSYSNDWILATGLLLFILGFYVYCDAVTGGLSESVPGDSGNKQPKYMIKNPFYIPRKHDVTSCSQWLYFVKLNPRIQKERSEYLIKNYGRDHGPPG